MRGMLKGMLSVLTFFGAGAEGGGFNRPNRKVSSIVFKFHLMVTAEEDGSEE